MSLLKKLVCRRISLVILSVCINIFAGAVSLRWNMQISSIINLIHANDPIAIRAIIAAVLLILISVVAEYLLSNVLRLDLRNAGTRPPHRVRKVFHDAAACRN